MNCLKVKIVGLGVIAIVLSTILFSCQENPGSKVVASVEFNSSRFAETITSRLNVSETDSGLVATLIEGGKPIQRAAIDQTQMQAFEDFISQLKDLESENLCTTVDSYKVVYKAQLIQKEDAGCVWQGFTRLKTALFTTPE
jgi:hypothetical protein